MQGGEGPYRDHRVGDASSYCFLFLTLVLSRKAKRCIVHFFHRDFRRCKIMDKHLEVRRFTRNLQRTGVDLASSAQKLASKHFDTLFLRAEVSNVPFLVTKLEIKVLPCVIGFVDGLSKMKYVESPLAAAPLRR